jgi:hypothetical protein
MTPVSLLTAMIETREVVGRMAASNSCSEITPFFCTGRYVISKPSSPSFLHESNTHLCSYNMMSSGKQLGEHAHSLRRNDVTFFLFMKTSNAFDSHVICFGGA